MNWRRFWKSLFSTSHLMVRVEGHDAQGRGFVAKLPYGESLETPEQQAAFLAHARQRLRVDQGVTAQALRIVGACEVWEDISPTGKVGFEATLADGRKLSGRMPYEGDLGNDPGFADIRRVLSEQLLVKTGQRCVELHITGAY